jgi:hypothetical protein
MKRNILPLLLVCMLGLSSCELIGGIFKAGYVTGIVVVVLFIAIVGGIIMAVGRGGKS